MSQLWDYDPLTGMERWLDYDHADDRLIVEHRQDVTPYMEKNKALVTEGDHRGQMKRDWIKYASVPNILIMNWKRDHGVDFFTKDPDEWRRVMGLINSRDYSMAVKTTPITHDR